MTSTKEISAKDIAFDDDMMRSSGVFRSDQQMRDWKMVTAMWLAEGILTGYWLRGIPELSERAKKRVNGKRYVFLGWSDDRTPAPRDARGRFAAIKYDHDACHALMHELIPELMRHPHVCALTVT
jgi:hypothetical protein